mmetsp:Transcript_7697/g.12460  ORF Transcript_7697/g.12460 Transcript_7697/m.12460 type:complete len:403 (-) Transcript_7697:39-1247(-)
MSALHGGAPKELWSSPALTHRKHMSLDGEFSEINLDDSLIGSSSQPNVPSPTVASGDSGNEVLYRGFLKKKTMGRDGLYAWKFSEHLVVKEKQGVFLVAQGDDEPKVRICLHNRVDIIQTSASLCRFDICFNDQIYSFLADTPEECKKWVILLNSSKRGSSQDQPLSFGATWGSFDADDSVLADRSRLVDSFKEDKENTNSQQVRIKKKVKKKVKKRRVATQATSRLQKSTASSVAKSIPKKGRSPSPVKSRRPTRSFVEENRRNVSKPKSPRPVRVPHQGIVKVKEEKRAATRGKSKQRNPLRSSRSPPRAVVNRALVSTDVAHICREQELEIARLRAELEGHQQGDSGGIGETARLKKELAKSRAERDAFEQLFNRVSDQFAKLKKEHQVHLELCKHKVG